MRTFYSLIRFFTLGFILAEAAPLWGQTSLVIDVSPSSGVQTNAANVPDPATLKIPSGQSYNIAAAAHGGIHSNTTVTVTVTKSGGTTYTSTASGTFGAVAGTTATTDTGNHYVTFLATASNTDNQNASQSVLVKVYVPDTTAPAVPSGLNATGVSPTQFTLVWNTSTDDQLVDYYEVASNGVTLGYVLAGSAPFPATYSYVYSGLTQGTTYSMTVRARDWAGNYSAWSSALGVTTTVPDTTPPTQPGTLLFSNVGLAGATVSWAPSTDNIGLASYVISLLQGGINGSVLSAQTITSPNYVFSGLSPGTTYGVSVVAKDAAGNTSTASKGAFSTLVATAPYPLSATLVNDTNFSVTWGTCQVAPATDHYQVQLNGGTPISAGGSGNTAQLGYSFTGLQANTAYTVRVQAVSTTGALSNWSDLLTVTTDVTTVALSTVTRPTGTGTLVASAGGNLSVDNHGSANYSIPLQISPGRGGLQPSLSLNYSSGAGNGVAGVGWALSTGFAQSITRGRSILARDGVVQGVTFTTNDKFYLDGKRLICVSGTSGQAGSVYRTEVDSFVTITASGSGTNIDSFTLVDKSGNVSTFGKMGVTTDAYQKGGGELTGLAYAYALKQVTDPLGNYVAFTYTPLGGGEYVLTQIDYTGGTGVSPAAQVVLAYESRPDQPVTYLTNRAFSHRARLAVVTAKGTVGGNLVTTAAYGLNYGNDANNGRSRLTSLAPVLADPVSQVLQTCPPTVIAWQNNDNGFAATGTTPTTANDVQWADTNGDGIDEPIVTSDSVSYTIKTGDFDGDGKKDQLRLFFSGGGLYSMGIYLANGTTATLSSAGATAFWSYFVDPGSQNGSHLLLAAEGMGVSSRITVADFDGDGRDDILVHGFDGKIHLFISKGATFADPIDDSTHSVYMGGQGDVTWESGWMGQGTFNTWIDSHYYVKPIPCDLNGDGRTDYVCITYTRIMKYPSSPYQTQPTGFVTIRNMTGVLSLADGTGGTKFSSPFPIGGPAMMVPTETNEPAANTGGVIGSIKLDDVNCGAFAGDFNGDGLTDFLVLVPQFEMQPGLYSGYYGSHRWALYLNQGEGPSGLPVFAEYKGPIPNTVTLPNGDLVNSYYTPTKSTGNFGYLSTPVQYITATSPQMKDFYAGFEGAAGSINNFVMDINHDGLADLVWYVALKSDESNATAPGWYALLSTGNFVSGGGFTGPVRLDFLNNVSGGVLNTLGGSGSAFNSRIITNTLDANGDGHPDYYFQPTLNGRPSGGGTLNLGTASNGTSVAPYNDLVSTITDGLGRVTSVAYKGAKDSTVYTSGAAVTYPIRELMAATPVVSDVFQDSGSTTPAQFSYQYSGNRIDLSGRGALGFHSFVTLDRQTNLFKYQFLTQSFPMTGLTAREQTYRYLAAQSFNIISSHDNTVVFDKVSTGGGATLWPFISQAVEYRWEDGAGHLTSAGASISSDPEGLFPLAKPSGAYITITAQSRFDGQASPQLTLPTAVSAAGYNPSDLLGSANTVVGTAAFSTFSTLPGTITYGNLTQLSTDYGSGYTETVTTVYKPVSYNGLPGLVDTVTTAVTAPGYNDSAPTKGYNYYGATPLVSSETVTASPGNLSTTTTYNRDTLGRVTSTVIAGTDLQFAGQGSVSYTTATYGSFDTRFGLPGTVQNNYGHTTTTGYGTFLPAPTSVTKVNGDQYSSVYDALGRTIQTVNVNLGLTTTNTYAPTTAQVVAGPSGFNGVASGSGITGVVGVTLTSAYSITTSTTVQPTVVTYYDRLGRVIRTIKTGFGGQQIYTDTAYNNLGQVIATSLPYPSGNTPLWTTTTYDALGRVATVTAPNSTVTTNAYAGRTTTVTVVPVVGTTEANATLVDAKGRTVSVWNADNINGTTPSISFALDGFGRMRTTTLLGQSQVISASYDALGRQTQLADPDKGTWNYVNSALGQVLSQTDAKGNVTTSTFDRLGRPLTRVTSGGGATETAGFYYYDTATDATRNLVAKGTQGWIGAPQHEDAATSGAPGYAGVSGFNAWATTNLHYYDTVGRPSLELALVDGQWFYTYTGYDLYSRVALVSHYWRPPGHEAANDQPYVWQNFGYAYAYDANSYLLSISDNTNRVWWDQPSYDYLDRVTSVRKGAGHITTRTYRATDGALTGIATNSAIQNLSFDYDGLGNLTYRSDGSHSETFGYDNLNRLTGAGNTGSVTYLPNGNINTKGSVNNGASSAYGYDPIHPHAVTGAFGYTMGYDANGNLASRSGGGSTWSLAWAGFDKPRWMAKMTGTTTVGSEFHYNAARSRVMQLEFDAMSAGAPSHYVRKRLYGLGSTLEANYTNSAGAGVSPSWALKNIRIYIPGPDGVIGAREYNSNTPLENTFVYHYDHLGSIQAITNYGDTGGNFAADTASEPGRYSEDAWGQRRDPISFSGPIASTDHGGAGSLTPRGFTGHEMLDDLGLVHMNGRIYDPLLGRMLSADILVQNRNNLQAYNRYSYVFNNPLSLTDPSGFKTISDYEKEIEKNKAELAKQRANAQGSFWGSLGYALNPKNWARGSAISNAEGAIRSIESHAGRINDITHQATNARDYNDENPVYQLQSAGMRFGIVPFASVGGEIVAGNPKAAAKDAALQGLFFWAFRSGSGGGVSETEISSRIASAAAEGAAEAAERRAVAQGFFEAQGVRTGSIPSYFKGLDFTKDVAVSTIPKGTRVVQYVGEHGQGNWYAPAGTPSTQLGISGEGRVATEFITTKDVQVLQSTARDTTYDTSLSSEFRGPGTGTQYFTREKSAFTENK